MKSDQYLFENFWCDVRKLLWLPELNPRVRCAFDDVFNTIGTVHNVQFVKYDVTVSFMAQVLDTVTYLVPQVLDTAS